MKSSENSQTGRLTQDGGMRALVRGIARTGVCLLFIGAAAAEEPDCRQTVYRDNYQRQNEDLMVDLDRAILYGSLEQHADKLNLILTFLEKSCNEQDAEACVRLGDINYFEELARVLITEDLCDLTFTEMDIKLKKRSALYYEKACDLKKAQSCGNAAMVHEQFLSNLKDIGRVTELYERGCNLGDGRSCSKLAMIYYTGYGVAPDHAKAYGYLKKAREFPTGDMYDLTGVLYYNGEFLGRDYKLAFENFRKGCELGSGFSCGQLGTFYHAGTAVQKDRDQALIYFGRGCSLEDGSSCLYAGLHYLNRNNTDRDYDSAYGYFESGCELGEASSCFYLGYMNKYGLGRLEDYKQALIYLRRGCSYRENDSCKKVDMPAENGVSDPKNHLKRAQLRLDNFDFDKKLDASVKDMLESLDGDCNRKNPDACNFLGEYYSENWKKSGEEKHKKARHYMKMACDLEYADGCYNIGMSYYDAFITGYSKSDLMKANSYFKLAQRYFPSMRNSSMSDRTSTIIEYFDTTPAGLKRINKRHR